VSLKLFRVTRRLPIDRLARRPGAFGANGAPDVELGVLIEITGYERNKAFEYAPYTALFGDL
jgi:hypothetical protein